MLIDARNLSRGQRITTDVCIVGAGVAGLTLARELVDRPVDVCVLESGGSRRDPATKSLAEGENVGRRYLPLARVRERRIGGSSNLWHHRLGRWWRRSFCARTRPLDAVDFEKREGLRYSGWPFGRSHLEPYYRRAEAVFELGAGEYELEDSEGEGGLGFPLREGPVRTVIYKLGPRDPFTEKYPRELARARNIRLFTWANVLEIETDEEGRNVAALRAACLDGKEFRVSARVFVLAAGGIEVPRLLLLSNRHRPAGLGNEHDLVGRFFMEHPHFRLGRFFPTEPNVDRAKLYWLRSARGTGFHGNLALTEELVRRERLLNVSIGLTPEVLPPLPLEAVSGVEGIRDLRSALRGGELSSDVFHHVGQIVRAAPAVTSFALQAAWARWRLLAGHYFDFRMDHMAEQSPNPDSRVTLSRSLDRFGQPRAQLEWRLQDADIRSVLRVHEILDAALARSGIGRVKSVEPGETPDIEKLGGGGHHHMGTTRMHTDPRRGVVDEQCRVHGVSNLYIAGSSVFPTSGCANPNLTIGALTLRLADHLKEILERPRREVRSREATT